MQMLLDAGADPNTTSADGETVLMTAARTGRVEAARALLVRGANVNAAETWMGETALMWAAAEGHAAMVKLLAEAGAAAERARRPHRVRRRSRSTAARWSRPRCRAAA